MEVYKILLFTCEDEHKNETKSVCIDLGQLKNTWMHLCLSSVMEKTLLGKFQKELTFGILVNCHSIK